MAYVNAVIAGVEVVSALAQGKSDRKNANTQAISYDYEADQEEQAAMQEADIIRRARDYSVARATAAYAGSGVRVDKGSATVVEDQINEDGTHDAYQAILNGQRRANQLRANAKIVAAGGQVEATQAYLQGGASALQSGYRGYEGWVTRNPKMAGDGNVGAGLTGYGHGGF